MGLLCDFYAAWGIPTCVSEKKISHHSIIIPWDKMLKKTVKDSLWHERGCEVSCILAMHGTAAPNLRQQLAMLKHLNYFTPKDMIFTCMTSK